MKLLSTLFLGSLMLLKSVASSQEYFPSGARFQSIADASSALGGIWSVYANQAGLAKLSNIELAASYQNRYLLRELSTNSLIFALPVQSSVFAMSFSQFGKNTFRHEMFGLSYARQVLPELNVGLQFNYYRLFMAEDHRYAGSVGFEMGIQYLISHDFTIGAHVLNPYQTGFHTLSGDFQYPCIIGFGVAYQFSEPFLVTSEVEYDFSSHLIFKTGMEYAWLEKFFIRGGFSLKPYLLTFGFGFILNKVSIDLSGTYHQYLGYSPAVSFQYRF